MESIRKIKTIILAAGYGTRLYPLTRKRPKPLIRVGGRPILDHILTRLRRVKCMKKVVIVTNNKYTKNFQNWAHRRIGKRNIKILNDGSTNKHESLGAIADMEFGLRQDGISEDLLVVAGDNIFDFPINPFIQPLPHEGARVGLYDVEDRDLAKNYGIVDLDDGNRITDFVEKPSNPQTTLASIGMYLLTPESQQMVKKYIEGGNDPDDIGLFIAWLKDRLPVYGHVFKGNWFDIGDHGSLNKARDHFEIQAA